MRVENKDKVLSGESPEKKPDSPSCTLKKHILRAVLFFGGAFIVIFLFAPAILLMAANIWPDVFHNEFATAALTKLQNGVNDSIAIVSLFVGIFSIFYAYSSNETMSRQADKQEEVMRELCADCVEIVHQVKMVRLGVPLSDNKQDSKDYGTPFDKANANEE